MADATTNPDPTVGTAAESTAPEPAVETTPVEPVQKAKQTAEPEVGTPDEAGNELKAALEKIAEYEKAETRRNEDKLKAEGKLQEVIDAKENQITEMQKQIQDRARVENMRAYLKVNNVDPLYVDSKLPTLLTGDYFEETNEIKKDAFKKIIKEFPFLEPKKEPNAQFQQPASFTTATDMASFVEQQIDVIGKNKELKGIITGTPLLIN